MGLSSEGHRLAGTSQPKSQAGHRNNEHLHIYSFPLSIDHNGKWTIVDGLTIDEFSKDKMVKTGAELVDERKMALGI